MKKLFVAVIAATLLLSGCSVAPRTGDVYSRGETLNVMDVRMGTLEASRVVKLEGSRSGAGAIAGAAIGGVAGSALGNGKGKTLLTLIGAMAGASAGAAMESGQTSSQGVELIIRMDNGNLIAVVQELSEEAFNSGQRVRVISYGYKVRVTRA